MHVGYNVLRLQCTNIVFLVAGCQIFDVTGVWDYCCLYIPCCQHFVCCYHIALIMCPELDHQFGQHVYVVYSVF